MGRETDPDPILALDKRIEETTAELIQLKRSRNSLLAVMRPPPETLGHIFRLSATPAAAEGHFAGLRKDSYNFLLVCHHWSEVARHTPELWSFWGNSLEVWKRQYPHSGTFPLDLVLDGEEHRAGLFDGALPDVLREQAARDAIRKVHLRGHDIQLLTTIVSTLTPEDSATRESSIESIVLDGLNPPNFDPHLRIVDVSDFFSRHRFPKLQNLSLTGHLNISAWAWACLKSHTAALTDLSLSLNSPFSILTRSQILSLLASNPNIRSLKLVLQGTDHDNRGGSKFRVPLYHLEELCLVGEVHHVFPILHEVELPERVDRMKMSFRGSSADEIREAIGPHIREYLRRDPRFEGRLGVCISIILNAISLRVGVIGVGDHGPDRPPQRDPPYATFSVTPRGARLEERERLCIYVLSQLPQESIVYLETNLSAATTKEMVVAMSNLEALYLINPVVFYGFLLPYPDRLNPHAKLLPSLRRLCLQDAKLDFRNPDWSHLVHYVTRQTSGNHAFSLNIYGGDNIPHRLVEQMKGLVEEFTLGPSPGMDRLSHGREELL